jgi:hypothetical protein
MQYRVVAAKFGRCFFPVVGGFVLLAALAVVLAGCGTGDYEQKLRDRKIVTKFDNFLPAENVPEAKIAFRIPGGFAPLAKGPKIDPKRTEPGVLKASWFKRVYETLLKDGDNEKACYCYVGAVEKLASADFEKQIKAELAAIQGNAIVEWTDFQGEKPDAETVKWRKIRCTAPLEFYGKDKAGKEQFQTEPGIVEVYFREEDGVVAIVAWKLPASLENGLKLGDISKLVAGGLTIAK